MFHLADGNSNPEFSATFMASNLPYRAEFALAKRRLINQSGVSFMVRVELSIVFRLV